MTKKEYEELQFIYNILTELEETAAKIYEKDKDFYYVIMKLESSILLLTEKVFNIKKGCKK